MVDGVLIAGACQGPKSSAESVASGLAAVTQSASVLKKGFAELDPLVATVDPTPAPGAASASTACPYGASTSCRSTAARSPIDQRAACKGCGGCVPSARRTRSTCAATPTPRSRPMIDGLLEEAIA
jgi:heterodisulfide reductase subunit A